jgi:hypothetical protein
MWFLPALAWSHFSGVRSGGGVTLALLVGVAVYAASARLNAQRQFWHDLIAGTRLVLQPPPARRRG